MTSVLVWGIGDSPFLVFKVLFVSAFGSAENVSYTLFYATPLILTGTAVSVALSSGLFNIGAEGQLYMGALAAITWGMLTKNWAAGGFLQFTGAWLGGIVFSFLGGAFWGWISGYLKAKKQTHEVISTIMLNFIAMAFVNWVIINPFKNPENQSTETAWISEVARMPRMWLQTTYMLPVVIVGAFFILWAIQKTWWGFRLRATGLNSSAASTSGIQTNKVIIQTMALSGGIAGLVGFHEVFCNSYRLMDSFSPGFGFTGLAIALIARGNFPKLIIASIVMSILQKGALDLDMETEKITRDLSAVIQALILFALAVLSSSQIKSHGVKK